MELASCCNKLGATCRDQSEATYCDQSGASCGYQSEASCRDQSEATCCYQTGASCCNQSEASCGDQSDASYKDQWLRPSTRELGDCVKLAEWSLASDNKFNRVQAKR